MVLASDGVSAAHAHGLFEEIQASDASGVHTVDSVMYVGPPPVLTDLKLTGNVLSWRHAGTLRHATLKP